MKTVHDTKQNKGVRIVVRVSIDDSQWLAETAARTDSSLSRVVRMAIRKLKSQAPKDENSFNRQLALALAA